MFAIHEKECSFESEFKELYHDFDYCAILQENNRLGCQDFGVNCKISGRMASTKHHIPV